jgi:hypothetical protein
MKKLLVFFSLLFVVSCAPPSPEETRRNELEYFEFETRKDPRVPEYQVESLVQIAGQVLDEGVCTSLNRGWIDQYGDKRVFVIVCADLSTHSFRFGDEGAEQCGRVPADCFCGAGRAVIGENPDGSPVCR